MQIESGTFRIKSSALPTVVYVQLLHCVWKLENY